MFALGFISGILFSFLTIFVIFSSGPDSNDIHNFSRKTKQKLLKREAEFFDSGSIEEDALEELYEQNRKKGEDTPL